MERWGPNRLSARPGYAGRSSPRMPYFEILDVVVNVRSLTGKLSGASGLSGISNLTPIWDYSGKNARLEQRGTGGTEYCDGARRMG